MSMVPTLVPPRPSVTVQTMPQLVSVLDVLIGALAMVNVVCTALGWLKFTWHVVDVHAYESGSPSGSSAKTRAVPPELTGICVGDTVTLLTSGQVLKVTDTAAPPAPEASATVTSKLRAEYAPFASVTLKVMVTVSSMPAAV